jgi:hypothetical protein
VGELVDVVVGAFPLLTAIAATVLVISRLVRSALGRAICAGLIAVGVALISWWSRWLADSCSDQADLGGCADLSTAFTVIGVIWIALLVLAGAAVLARRGVDPERD